ncbi:atlastin-2-like [Ornithodoros turicata]|uniref:atlastin-2-like n=1 Tax=Ornithodoros turicata TaxID=34597 RepID=UPI0031396DAA
MATPSTSSSKADELRDSTACPIVVRPHHDTSSLELRIDNLSSLLIEREVADLPVVVVSVAGPCRLGKSFLLGFCIRYLEHLETSSNQSDWKDEENIPLTGFSWKYGSKRETTGIQLWRKVFKVKTPQYGIVAVILMDTEGAFDSTSTLEGNVAIFSMSMLLSSVQVYNLNKQITQSDLEHLKLFAEYASMAQSKGGQGKEAFQKLLFLVRDWQYPGEQPFGLEGGKALLDSYLGDNPSPPDEVRQLRKNIRASFGELGCFLMPRPGDAIENTIFDGRLRDISGVFKRHLRDLLSYLLSPERLVPKKVNGRIINCKELLWMFQTYFTVFDQKELPQPMSVFNATAFIHNKRIRDEIIQKYETEMEKATGVTNISASDADIEMNHNKLKEECLSQFDKEPKLGDHHRELREQLIQDIDGRYETWKRSRKLLKDYTNEMEHRVGKERDEARRVYEKKMKEMIEEEHTKRNVALAAMEEKYGLDMEKMRKSMETAARHARIAAVLQGIPVFGPLVGGIYALSTSP